MKQLSTYNKRKYKTYKSAPTLDPRLVALVKLLARSAAEEDNAAIHSHAPCPKEPDNMRDIKDSK